MDVGQFHIESVRGNPRLPGSAPEHLPRGLTARAAMAGTAHGRVDAPGAPGVMAAEGTPEACAAPSGTVPPTSAAKGIYWIGGSKGGVGKSLMTMAVLEHLRGAGHAPVLVECDTSNPDVWKTYHDEFPAELIDLDGADGWIHFVNTCEAAGAAPVVVNTAARNNGAVRRHGGTLDGSLSELGRTLVALWMINRQRDSLELLREFLDRCRARSCTWCETGTSARSRSFSSTTRARSARRSRAGAADR